MSIKEEYSQSFVGQSFLVDGGYLEPNNIILHSNYKVNLNSKVVLLCIGSEVVKKCDYSIPGDLLAIN